MAYLFDPNMQIQDRNGRNNVNGFLRVYLYGTDDRATTYRNFDGTLNSADIRLDNNGRAVVIVDATKAYRLEVYDRHGILLWTQQPLSARGEGRSEYVRSDEVKSLVVTNGEISEVYYPLSPSDKTIHIRKLTVKNPDGTDAGEYDPLGPNNQSITIPGQQDIVRLEYEDILTEAESLANDAFEAFNTGKSVVLVWIHNDGLDKTELPLKTELYEDEGGETVLKTLVFESAVDFATSTAVHVELYLGDDYGTQTSVSIPYPVSRLEFDALTVGTDDIHKDADGHIWFKDRTTGLSGSQKGYFILRPGSLSSQLTRQDTIYEVRYPFDLGGTTVSIPTGAVFYFNGGFFYNGTLNGELKTTSGFIRPTDIGITSSSSASETAARLKLLEGITNKITLSLDFDLAYSAYPEANNATLNSLEIEGHGKTIRFGANGRLNVIGDLCVKNTSITNNGSSGGGFATPAGTSGRSSVRFEKCHFEGDCRAYTCSRRPSLDENLQPVLDGLKKFELVDCTGHNTYSSSGTNCVFMLQDTYYENLLVERCKFVNIPTELVNAGITNASTEQDIIVATEANRNAVIRDSVFMDEADFDFSSYPNAAYVTTAVVEFGKLTVENCTFDNITAEARDPDPDNPGSYLHNNSTYDIYASCRYYQNRNNLWKNCINTTAVIKDDGSEYISNYNCFIKAKGAGGEGSHRVFEHNTYILDKQPPAGYKFYLQWFFDNSEAEKDITVVRDCKFYASSIYVNANARIKGDQIEFAGNYASFGKLFCYQFGPLFAINRSKWNIANNKIDIEQAVMLSSGSYTPCVIASSEDSTENDSCECDFHDNTVIGPIGDIIVCNNNSHTKRKYDIHDNVFNFSTASQIATNTGICYKYHEGVTLRNNVINTPKTYVTGSSKFKKFELTMNTDVSRIFSGFATFIAASETWLAKVQLEANGEAVATAYAKVMKDSTTPTPKLSMRIVNSSKEEILLDANNTGYKVAFIHGPLAASIQFNQNGIMQVTSGVNAYYPQLTYRVEFVKASKLIGYPSSAASAKIQTWTDMVSGQSVFDETLGKTIWWNGTKWVLADGSDAYTP